MKISKTKKLFCITTANLLMVFPAFGPNLLKADNNNTEKVIVRKNSVKRQKRINWGGLILPSCVTLAGVYGAFAQNIYKKNQHHDYLLKIIKIYKDGNYTVSVTADGKLTLNVGNDYFSLKGDSIVDIDIEKLKKFRQVSGFFAQCSYDDLSEFKKFEDEIEKIGDGWWNHTVSWFTFGKLGAPKS
ncbi:MAG: hypothetical protein RsTaC01_0203 [Candidatus Paraimprobicoccus trichonymphae]|uniref:Uncharacterized protein n=1 Tax=Candidatus Paraimprobicoccus trichonymphae TaxID=3033793 RepID=A0AA48KW01_9FIRM|nr:MAG: hypothetical protein RsTaC01_0203 [Candidatus Paraimprobicoccus trichonymphae]